MTNNTLIKFCGITRPQDIQAAVALGIDMIGLNFYPPSPRYVGNFNPEPLLSMIPDAIKKIGVMVDIAPDEASRIAQQWSLDMIQLCGREPAESLDDYCLPIIKAIRMESEHSLEQLVRYSPAFFLLDAYKKGIPGGTGDTFDWQLAIRAIEASPVPVILAGGLTPNNVGEAVQLVKPYAVDVAGGIEKKPGIKDPGLMRQFIEAVRSV
jgi:phosphoribosylanthranilate isomerase